MNQPEDPKPQKNGQSRLPNRPKAIYLETSVLCKLPLDIINAEMQRLQQWSKLLKSNIHIPEVSLKEWMPKRREAVQKWINEADGKIDKLSRVFPYVPKIDWKKQKHEIVGDTEKITIEILEKQGITIVPTPLIDLNMLIEMSINKKPPFQGAGEKGFRDSVILFTVLEFAKKQKKAPHLLVAEDRTYHHAHIVEIAKRWDVELIVAESIGQAISMLERFVEELVNVVIEKQKSVFKEFLIENTPAIEEYIKSNAEFNTSSLQWTLNAEALGEIEEITDIKVADIVSVTLGKLPEGVTEGRMKISFKVRTAVGVKAKPTMPFPQQKLKFGEKVSAVGGWMSWAMTAQHREPEDRTVSFNVQVEGTVHRTLDKKEKGLPLDVFSGLEIERIAI